jgi:hypothetical protein
MLFTETNSFLNISVTVKTEFAVHVQLTSAGCFKFVTIRSDNCLQKNIYLSINLRKGSIRRRKQKGLLFELDPPMKSLRKYNVMQKIKYGLNKCSGVFYKFSTCHRVAIQFLLEEHVNFCWG